LTEAEAVNQALRRAPLADVLAGVVAIEEGRGRSAGSYPTPEFRYLREQTFGDSGTAEDSLSLAQTIDLGDRRGRYTAAGEARTRAAHQEGHALRLAVSADARLRFHEALYRQGRVAALEGWCQRIEDSLLIVTRREQRGDAATYDRRRLEREQAVASSRLKSERAALERAMAQLVALLGPTESSPRVTGALLPESDPASLQVLRESADSHPEVLALDQRGLAATYEVSAGTRWWVPEVRLEAGWKRVNLGAQGRADGFLAGATLSLPLWNQSAGLAREAEGQAQAARGRSDLLRAALHGELSGARLEALRLREAAASFRAQASETSGDLVRMASAGYEGGELGLLELLDAYRGAAEDSLSALDLEYAARRARIDLDRLTGTRFP
jgi:cobalt-zinc-cadmium efflux system outer membrane protein